MLSPSAVEKEGRYSESSGRGALLDGRSSYGTPRMSTSGFYSQGNASGSIRSSEVTVGAHHHSRTRTGSFFAQDPHGLEAPLSPAHRWIELDDRVSSVAMQDPSWSYEETRRQSRYSSVNYPYQLPMSPSGSSLQKSNYTLPAHSSLTVAEPAHYPYNNYARASSYSLMYSRPSPWQSSVFHDDKPPLSPGAPPSGPPNGGKGPPGNGPPGKKEDPDLVTWSGPKDVQNPKNWADSTKWRITILVSLASFLSTFASSMVAPAIHEISVEFNSPIETTIMSLSIFILGYAVGPLFIAPVSEVFGRTIVLQSSMTVFLIFNLACQAARNNGALIAFRLFAGMGGSAALVVGGGTISDVWPREKLGQATGMYTLAPLIGPAAGPLVSAFIVSGTTWRWLFRMVAIACAVFQIATFLLLPETYAPAILQKRLNRLKTMTGNEKLHLEADNNLRKALGISLVRPFRLLGTQPIVQVISLYMAYIFGLFYLLLASFPDVWVGVYGQSVAIGGLNYLSLAIGYLIGALLQAMFGDKIHARLTKANGGKPRPEFRIPSMFLGSVLMPIGMFWYGFSAEARTHWIVPNLGMVVFSAGSVFCLQAMQTYVIESYRRFAASALAAVVVLRSIAGFTVPLAAPAMYEALGLDWGNGLLGFIGVVVGIPAPFIFWYFGERLRKHSQYAAD